MTKSTQTSADNALTRAGYAWRVAGCLVGLLGVGAVLGPVFRSALASDPMNAVQVFFGIMFVANAIAGGFFVYFTHRRALDCKFGQNGNAWIATLVALPTVVLPQYGLLVFTVMMFFKSASQDAEASEIVDDAGVLRSLQADG